MSQLIIPALALGGVYLLYEGLTKKKKSKHHSHSSSSSSGSSSSSSSDSDSSSSSSSRSRSHSKRINVRNTTKKRKEETKKQLFAFYTIGNVRNKKWTYKSLPSGWSVQKKGDANKYTSSYTKMVVFNGPTKNRDDMKKYANKVFEYLKKKGIIRNFKISSDAHI